jgi:hypothetical protein
MEILAENPHVSRGGFEQPRQHFYGGGLTRTVRSQKAEKLSRLDVQGNVVHGGEPTEAPGEPLA